MADEERPETPRRPLGEGGVWGSYVAYLEALERDVVFWREQQKFASDMCATIADLDEVAPALRKLLRSETERRREAENEVARLSYQVQLLTGTQA